jgi:hypothetical protein
MAMVPVRILVPVRSGGSEILYGDRSQDGQYGNQQPGLSHRHLSLIIPDFS